MGESKIEQMKELIKQHFNDLLSAYKEGNEEERPREVVVDNSSVVGVEDDV